MRFEWIIEPGDLVRVHELMDTMATDAFVLYRKKNLQSRSDVTVHELWFQMLSARLTTVQRSGPGSAVATFTRMKPHPLKLGSVRAAVDPGGLISATLRKAGGIRFADKIGAEMARNVARLLIDEGAAVLAACNKLTQLPASPNRERAAASVLMEFVGFGPKQSRNVLQSLGLTRYEIPIDSRVTNWLNLFGFPIHLNARTLAEPAYYDFVSDGVIALCKAAGIYPCMLDAAIFASQDGGAWTPENVNG